MLERFVFVLVLVGCLQRTSQYSLRDLNPLDFIELALREGRVTLDELLAENGSLPTNASFKETTFFQLFHNEPDFDFKAQEMIEYRGFKAETHHVITEDCYILEMHRVVHPNDIRPNKPPVLLQHGLVDSSNAWIMNSIGGHLDDQDDRNLAFALAKRGYDVWLGNFRGNTYSKNHTQFSSNDSQFWKFTFDNHALQDLPAQIGYIQNQTNYDQIAYVGFSQGSLSMFELLALRPETSKAIKPFIALAPVAFLGKLASPLRYFASSDQLMSVLLYRNSEILSNSPFTTLLLNSACRAFPDLVCLNSLYLFSGFSNGQMNSTRLPVYTNHVPAGSSIPNYVHFGQGIKSGRFQMLDYMSTSQNIECYGNPVPPQVPVENINIPDLFLFHSDDDLLADTEDVERLKRTLRVPYYYKRIEGQGFSHVDFVFSQNSDYFVNNDVIEILRARVPAMSVPGPLRFRTFDSSTCNTPNRESACHMNIRSVVQNMYLQEPARRRDDASD